MKIAVDFHIHTALSPCGDEDMTPNNILNMSLLKGLDAIAITDHNSVENCEACIKLSKEKNIIVIPGMELQTKEEVHLLCLFDNMQSALDFQKLIYSCLPKQENVSEIFGKQLVFNTKDEVINENKRMLINSANISINEAFDEVKKRNGFIIPAHVDKGVYSLIANLGFIPKELHIKTIEISKKCKLDKFLIVYPYLSDYQFIRNSDAHYLTDILERENFIEVKNKSIRAIFKALKKE